MSAFPFAKFMFWYGDHFVELFFIISGFVIASGYKSRLKIMTFMSFMKGRISKVFLPVALAELIAGIVIPVVGEIEVGNPPINALKHIPDFYRWLQSFTLSANGYLVSKGVYPIAIVTWYINVLIICYAIYAIIVRLSKTKEWYIPNCLFMVLFGYICIYNFDLPLLWHANGRGYCSFFVGVILYEIQVNTPMLNKTKLSYVVGVFTVVLVLLGHIYGYKKVFGNIRMTLIFWIYPVMILCILNINWLMKLLEINVLKKVSKMSLPIYLTHDVTITVIRILTRKFEPNISWYDWKIVICVLAVVVINAIIFVYLLEKFNALYKIAKNFFIEEVHLR